MGIMGVSLSTVFALFFIILCITASNRSTTRVVGDDDELGEGSGEGQASHTNEYQTDDTPTESLLMDVYRDYVLEDINCKTMRATNFLSIIFFYNISYN